MANVLILGKGYIGEELFSHLAIPLSTIGNVYLFSRKTFDYHDESKLRKFIGNKDITHIINCAGFTGRPNVDEGETKKQLCWDLNVRLPLMLSKVCKVFGINYFHISSGCIYDGYTKDYDEEDVPNFGMFNDSSFYSKTKHAFETLNDYGCTIRVRMPFSNTLHERNYLTKILNYDNIINVKNSKTYIPDLCSFLRFVIEQEHRAASIGVINFVNPHALNTSSVVQLMTDAGLENKNWRYVDIADLAIKAPRSNCVLSIKKLQDMFPDFEMQTETAAMRLAIENITSHDRL
jgi:dTDP-4-dehydrorhamnose reductase